VFSISVMLADVLSLITTFVLLWPVQATAVEEGMALARGGDLSAAAERFAQVCQASNAAQACYLHARALYQMNRFREAADVLRGVKASREGPSAARLLLLQGQIFEALRQPAEAEKALSAAWQQSGTDDAAAIAYADFLWREGRHEELVAALRKARERHPRTAWLAYLQARVVFQREGLPAAMPILDEALRLDPALEAAQQLRIKWQRRN
jgi:tetratricopeptide (TPR) repeat protein